ncbi:MAG: T9SS type A sorting domain-containing protein [Bacteroidia bacterium]
MKNKTIFFIVFCWLTFNKLLAQPYTINRSGTAPSGTTLILADIINSNEQISGGDNRSYRGTQYIHLTDGFSASGLTNSDLFHAYIQPLQVAYIAYTNAGNATVNVSQAELTYANAGSYTSAVPLFSRFEIGIQLPADIQSQIDYFLNPNTTLAPNSSYCNGCIVGGTNPYDPDQIQIEVDFTNGTNTSIKYGFYYKDFSEGNLSPTTYNNSNPWDTNTVHYPFRVRFCPPSIGNWNFTVKLILASTPVASYTGGIFNVINSTDKGYLSLNLNTMKMKFQDGTAFFGLGEDIPFEMANNTDPNDYFYDADPYWYNTLRMDIQDLANHHGNFTRIRLDPWSDKVETVEGITNLSPPNISPTYINDPTPKQLINCVNNYDHNQRHMWEFDQTLALCENRGVYIMLNLLLDQYFSASNVYFNNDNAPYTFASNPYNALAISLGYSSEPGGPNLLGGYTTGGGIYNFFSDANMMTAYKKTLLYIINRWGYSTHIALLEHINETVNLGAYATSETSGTWAYAHYYDNTTFAANVGTWICTMADYIRGLDPNHLQVCGNITGIAYNPNSTGGNNITGVVSSNCLDVYSTNDYDGGIAANTARYSNNTANYGGPGLVTQTQMNAKPFIMGETGTGCNGSNSGTSVDSDAPDDNSDIEFHKSLWASAFTGGIATALWWQDWNQTTSYGPAAQHRNNFDGLNTFLTNIPNHIDFIQKYYPQNEWSAYYPSPYYPVTNYGGGTTDYNGDVLYKHVDNFFLSNYNTNATQAYGYCVNRSYWWQTDPTISNLAPNYMCTSTDSYYVNPNDAYGIDGNPSGIDPPIHFYKMYPNTDFSLAYYETAGAAYIGNTTATSNPDGTLDFYLPFGAGANIDATHPPDYAYVLSLSCVGCQRTANNFSNQASGISNTSAIQTQTKLGTNIKLGIFPNPTSGMVYLNLSAQNAGALLVNVTDVNGNQLLHNNFAANEGANSFKLDLSTLNSGVYFINITDENNVPIKNDKLVLMGQ